MIREIETTFRNPPFPSLPNLFLYVLSYRISTSLSLSLYIYLCNSTFLTLFPNIYLHLDISHHINTSISESEFRISASLHLQRNLCISQYLSISLCVSTHFFISVSQHLPLYLWISLDPLFHCISASSIVLLYPYFFHCNPVALWIIICSMLYLQIYIFYCTSVPLHLPLCPCILLYHYIPVEWKEIFVCNSPWGLSLTWYHILQICPVPHDASVSRFQRTKPPAWMG